MTEGAAATRIQAWVRGLASRQRTRAGANRELVFIGMRPRVRAPARPHPTLGASSPSIHACRLPCKCLRSCHFLAGEHQLRVIGVSCDALVQQPRCAVSADPTRADLDSARHRLERPHLSRRTSFVVCVVPGSWLW